jgi:hypothetical protein
MSAARTGSEQMLRWTAGLGAVDAPGLAAREQISGRSARGRLAAAERRGELKVWRLLQGEAPLYTVTTAGLRHAGVSGLSPGRVSAGGARHAAACCGVAAWLALCFPDHRLLGEPAIRRFERELGRPLAGSGGMAWAAGAGASHRPDLLALPGEGLPIAVEVELTVKSPQRLAGICRAWARSREVEGVLYLAAEEVLAPLARAIETARAAERIVVLPIGAASAREPAGRIEGAIAGAA